MNPKSLVVFQLLASWIWTGLSLQATETPTVAPGWKIELVAQSPDLRHPSVVCASPDGRVFVAEDPMDIRNDTPANATAGRIVCLHPDGRQTIFADNLHAVFGMQYLEGKLFVLHNPRLTVFRDGGDLGNEPRDIITDTLPVPWAQDWNDHVPANFKLGMDGWFYLAVGDKGLFGCTGTDGHVLNFRGGGIVRFRPDGSGLEVFSTGVRNILDVAINAKDELFTYDNTDEHQWMGRFSHMVEAGEYGYPHNFIPRRPYTLWMMHDFGAGAACGTICATNAALSPEMAGNVFIADFGKRQVTRVRVENSGASYRMADSEDLLPNPPDDFRPVGLGWTVDGRGFYICDWQHRDNKEDVDAGRLWRMTWTGGGDSPPRPEWWQPLALGKPVAALPQELIEAFNHPSLSVRITAQRALSVRARDSESNAILSQLTAVLIDEAASSTARTHALWALDAIDGGLVARGEIMRSAKGPSSDLAAQALRQLSQRIVTAASEIGIVQLAHEAPTVRLQAATLLGRIGDVSSVESLVARLAIESDPTVRYSLFTALGRIAKHDSSAWSPIVAGFSSEHANVREGCFFATRDAWDEHLIPLLKDRAMLDAKSAERLGGLIYQFAPYRGEWWSYHPAKSPPLPRSTRWSGTDIALAACHQALSAASNENSRVAIAQALGASNDEATATALRDRLAVDPSTEVRIASLTALAQHKDTKTVSIVAELLRKDAGDNRLRLKLIQCAPAFGTLLAQDLIAMLSHDSKSSLRLDIIRALEPMRSPAARDPLLAVLRSGTIEERTAALRSLAPFADRSTTPDVLAGLADPDTDLAYRRAALTALAAAPDVRSIPAFLEGLTMSDPVINDMCRQGIGKLGVAVMPFIDEKMATMSPAILGTLRDIFKNDLKVTSHPSFSKMGGSDANVYAEFAMRVDGDPWRGQQIYYGAAGVSCAACHKIVGFGGSVGPDLTLAGKQFSRAELIESILYPSKVIRDGYRTWQVLTDEGVVFQGSLRSRDANGITLVDSAGKEIVIDQNSIVEQKQTTDSLMPSGLHAPLTVEQFADLVAYMVSRKSDPRTESAQPLPEGFLPVINSRDLIGWRVNDLNRLHWSVKDGLLEHDGISGDLWSQEEFADMSLIVEWRWPDEPRLTYFPIIDADGRQTAATAKVLDAGDSGIFLRGLRKAQANLFCYPVGSGEFWEYREDASRSTEFARSVTPNRRADAPIGDWNRMEIVVQGDIVSITCNSLPVVESQLPDLPASGPIGLQHEHGRIQFRTIAIKKLDTTSKR